MKNTRLLGVIVILQVLTLVGQWVGSGYLTSANAQVTDPGRDRLQMIEAMSGVNKRLDKLIDILESGQLQVHTITPDEAKGSGPAR